MSNLWNYLTECARLLYWMYFKPYTFEKWLKTIHPDLKAVNNPYEELKKSPNNQRFKHIPNFNTGSLWESVLIFRLF